MGTALSSGILFQRQFHGIFPDITSTTCASTTTLSYAYTYLVCDPASPLITSSYANTSTMIHKGQSAISSRLITSNSTARLQCIPLPRTLNAILARQFLLIVAVDRADLHDALEVGRGLLPLGRQVLTVPAWRMRCEKHAGRSDRRCSESRRESRRPNGMRRVHNKVAYD